MAGYAGYRLYPRFDLPAAEGAVLLLLAAGVQEVVVERLQASEPQIKRRGGALLLIVGTRMFVLGGSSPRRSPPFLRSSCTCGAPSRVGLLASAQGQSSAR